MLVRRRQPKSDRSVTIIVDGREVAANPGDTVAATVLASHNGGTRRNPVDMSARAPFCMMGVCFECLMTIDGRPNRQGCMIPVEEGMQVEFAFERRALGDG